ncbi:hypothetical protein, partial [Heliophilum fasciatum]|uniref:hypothetical protein n=1 Tax=Heliophilum fasciatum TaxID=35700 RepID=UPI001A9ADCF3
MIIKATLGVISISKHGENLAFESIVSSFDSTCEVKIPLNGAKYHRIMRFLNRPLGCGGF